jgi:hypothetical protein
MPVLLAHQYLGYNVDYEKYNSFNATVDVVISTGKRHHVIVNFDSNLDDAEIRAHSFIAGYKASMTNISVNDVNAELYSKAREAARKKGISSGDWLNDALTDKLILDGDM